MVRRQDRDAGRSTVVQGARGPIRFSETFIDEVAGCDGVEDFVALMESRGIWLNRNAASNVYGHLRSLTGESLSDDDLSGVTGGVFAYDSLIGDLVSHGLASYQ